MSALSPQFTVQEIEEHEDGSATFQIDGSKEDLQILFETFFVHALVGGIESAKASTETFVAQSQALKVADKLVRYLDVWETADEFDYNMGVNDVKNELKEALKKAGV
jgi:glucosamine 6-phosphate synthetase-like amidotransferase/phosphosugar isomerase protein